MIPVSNADAVLSASASAKRVIDDAWAHYGRIPTSALVDLTHVEGSPREQVWFSVPAEERENLTIPLPLIRDWFKARLAEKLKPKRGRGERTSVRNSKHSSLSPDVEVGLPCPS